jgi:hypothetical protein
MRIIINLFAITFLLSINNAYANFINPGFEDGSPIFHSQSDLPGWEFSHEGALSLTTWAASDIKTDDYNLSLFSQTTCANQGCGGHSFSPGDYISASQTADLTAINSITFDLQLMAGRFSNATSFQSFSDAVVYLGANEVFRTSEIGIYRDIIIDTSNLSGFYALDFRIEIDSFGVDSQSDQLVIDNIRTTVVPLPASGLLFILGLTTLLRTRKKPSTI